LIGAIQKVARIERDGTLRDESKFARRTTTAGAFRIRHRRIPVAAYQDRDNDFLKKTSIPPRWSELAAAMRDEQRRDGRGRGFTILRHATPGDHRDLTEPDREAKAGAFANTRAQRTRGSRR
jgi:hypothetical protein